MCVVTTLQEHPDEYSGQGYYGFDLYHGTGDVKVSEPSLTGLSILALCEFLFTSCEFGHVSG